MTKRKLIEVALPLEAINREAAREKSIRHGHPSTMHLWWARRPLAAARSVLFAQLVDDPSSNPLLSGDEQRKERDRLHNIIERLSKWENIGDKHLLLEAHREILKSSNGSAPTIVDPFAGGGAIPLEAQRLGLPTLASDINPVATLIDKSLIDIPQRFTGLREGVYPGGAQEIPIGPHDALAGDVSAYSSWMLGKLKERVGEFYPPVELPGGDRGEVIAWIWARTVPCPNPACRCHAPLVKSWWLGKKKGRESYLVPQVIREQDGNIRIEFSVSTDASNFPRPDSDGTVGRRGATCVACSASIPLSYIRDQGRAKNIGSTLLAIAAEGHRRRHYLPASPEHLEASRSVPHVSGPEGSLGYYPRDLKAPTYGLTEFSDLYTPRQLLTMCTLSELIPEVHKKVLDDCLRAGWPVGPSLSSGGSDALAYADAVTTYLGLGVSRYANFMNALCQWRPDAGKEQVGHLFSRQAIPMVWDYAEASPFSNSAGGWLPAFKFIPKAIQYLPVASPATAVQCTASEASLQGAVLSTDPPYYDNIGYSDLSDFFYVWLRRSLAQIHPELFDTLLVPKADELVANPYRHGGAEAAKEFFEDGFRSFFQRARNETDGDYPSTVYYAFKQTSDSASGSSSSGWETLLEGMLGAGWTITATWPLRSELGNRMIASGKNALASSIVLALRPRHESAPSIDRRGFIRALQEELPDALRALQQGSIAPVDLPQAAIGPGMAVFSRYSRVIENDGSSMPVRSALERINEILDEVLNEQEGDFDPTSRFALGWYRQHGYEAGPFGDADNLARARNTSVDAMARDEILTSRAGKVQLLNPSALRPDYDVATDEHTSSWEALHHILRALEAEGITAAGRFLSAAISRPDDAVDPDRVKELAHLLFRIAEDEKWTKDALNFNSLVTAWPDILEASRTTPKSAASGQGLLDFTEEEN